MRWSDENARVILFDIETTGLDAGFAFILCVAWKVLGEKKTHLISIADPEYAGRKVTDDSKVVRAISKVIMDADAIITFNGKRFDVSFIQTRRWIHGLDILPRRPHIDLYQTARSLFRLRSKSLKSISNLDPTIPLHKSAVTGTHWLDAMSGDKKAIRYVERHCVADVQVLEHEYKRMAQHIWMHPRLSADIEACRFCGGRVIRRGYGITALKNRPVRIQCTKCARWDQRVIPLARAKSEAFAE